MPLRNSITNAGFTLIEVLLAIALLGVLSAMAYGGLSSTLKTHEGTQRVMNRVTDLQRAMSLIQRDMEQIVARSMRNDANTLDPAVVGGGVGSSLITFTRTGWRMPKPPPKRYTRSELQRVAYKLEEGVLNRYHQFHVDPAGVTEPVKTPLLRDIEEVTFEFLDSQNQWQTSWPPMAYGANGQPSTATPPLPAIKMKVKLKDWGEITRLFMLTSLVTDQDTEPPTTQQTPDGRDTGDRQENPQ